MSRRLSAALLLLALATFSGCQLTQQSCHDGDGSGPDPRHCHMECVRKDDPYLRCMCSAHCPCQTEHH